MKKVYGMITGLREMVFVLGMADLVFVFIMLVVADDRKKLTKLT